MRISRCITGLFVTALVLVQPIERAASAHATERNFLASAVTQAVDDCSADDDSSTLPSPLEVYESTGQCTSNLVYQDIVCTPLTESSGECYLQSGISVSTSQTINAVTLPIESRSLNETALLGAGPAAAGLAPAALGAAQRTSFDVSIDFLNVVRFLVAESNKWPNDKFNNFAQWVGRRWWHTTRQGRPARANVINGNNGITPADWIAAGTEVLDTADAFGQRWGNCAEQASTLAGLIYNNTDLWVRVCYNNGHAWTEVTATPGGAANTVLALDPWADNASWGARGGSCTNWYRKRADGTWDTRVP